MSKELKLTLLCWITNTALIVLRLVLCVLIYILLFIFYCTPFCKLYRQPRLDTIYTKMNKVTLNCPWCPSSLETYCAFLAATLLVSGEKIFLFIKGWLSPSVKPWKPCDYFLTFSFNGQGIFDAWMMAFILRTRYEYVRSILITSLMVWSRGPNM